MTQPIRVLHFQGRMGKGGAETFMMNTYRNLDRTKIQFDFVVYHDFKDIQPYNEEIGRLGGKIYSVPNPKKHPLSYIKTVQKLLKNEKVDIVHNEVFFGGGLNLWLAAKAGIQKRIAHSHASTDGKNSIILSLIRKFLDRLMFKYATDFLACSTEAGIGLFGKDRPFIFVPNGIDIDMFQKFPESKIESKKALNILPNSIVLGNIGRFEKQKNHTLLIDIFNEVVKVKPQSELILIGEGSLENEIKKRIETLDLKNKVHLLGIREDIPRVLNAMDVMVMPSLYEGLPISAVEAQAAGVKLVLSTEVSPETVLSENVSFLSLENQPEEWAEAILKGPFENAPLLKMKKFDKNNTAKLMQTIYIGEESIK